VYLIHLFIFLFIFAHGLRLRPLKASGECIGFFLNKRTYANENGCPKERAREETAIRHMLQPKAALEISRPKECCELQPFSLTCRAKRKKLLEHQKETI